MTVTRAEIVGRDAELRSASAVLSDEENAVVVFRGDAGIGKTTLWEEATAAAAATRGRLLVARPLESEQQLGLASLADLLGPIADEVIAQLPPPQRRALESALLLADGADASDVRTLGAALVGSLRVVGRDSGAVLAVDDVQWLDPASRAAIAFALRRLSDARASAVLAVRGSEEPLPVFDRKSAVCVIDVGPLSLGAMQRLLSDRLGATFARSLLRRVHAASGGNPLYAIEIARALLDLDAPLPAGDDLPIPHDLDGLLRARVRALPPSTRRALAAAAALGEPRVELVEAEGDLQPAIEEGLAFVERGAVRFRHPLLASAALSLVAPNRRRALHGRLAETVEDVEQRARHLALASPGRDETVAGALEAAASRALARGAPASAGELLDLAIDRTTDDRLLAGRRAGAARSYGLAGELAAARRHAELAIDEMRPGRERARVLVLLSSLHDERLDVANALARQAWTEAQGDPAAEALAASHVAFRSVMSGDAPQARAFAQRALDRAAHLPDRTLVTVVCDCAFMDIIDKGRADPELLARGVAAEERTGGQSDGGSARLQLASQLLLDERLVDARDQLAKLRTQVEALGDEEQIAEALHHLAEVETRAGRPAAGARTAAEATALCEQIGEEEWRAVNSFFSSHAAAYLGLVDQARTTAEAGLTAARTSGNWGFTVQNSAVLGFLELSLGNAQAAVDVLAPVADQIAAIAPGMHPALAPVLPNLIEALISLGRLDEARVQLDRLEERGRALDSAWALAQAARSRGLLTAAAGEPEAALASFEEAMREHQRMEGPFERGRTLLALGVVQRRLRRWRAARESLAAASAIFEEVGAPLWTAKAQAELTRIGGRSAAGGLTPTEQRVAELVSSGRSNKEVASELFVTARTVESNLSRIYAKLGIRSRTELAARLHGS